MQGENQCTPDMPLLEILGEKESWSYHDIQRLSESERLRIMGIDEILKPLDDPAWYYWPSWEEAERSGKHKPDQLCLRTNGKFCCESRAPPKSCSQVPPEHQKLIKRILPLSEKYQIYFIDRPLGDTNKVSACAKLPLVYVVGERNGTISARPGADRPFSRVHNRIPKRGKSWRHINFPRTNYTWLSHVPYIFPDLYFDEYSDILPLKGLTDRGRYNAFMKPGVECLPPAGKPDRMTISIPIICVKGGNDLAEQKITETWIRNTPCVLRAPGYEDYNVFVTDDGETRIKPPVWHWTTPLDYQETSSQPMTIYGGRTLFEYRYPCQDTRYLDSRQTAQRYAIKGSAAGIDHFVCVDQMWAVITPKNDTLVTFQSLMDNSGIESGANTNTHQFTLSKSQHIAPEGAVHGFFVFFADLVLKAHPEIIEAFKDATANIMFRVSNNPMEDEEITEDCSTILTELSILIEVTVAQIEVLESVRESILDEEILRVEEFTAATKFYAFLKDRLEVVLGAFKDQQAEAKQAQSLLFQLLNIETAKQNARMTGKQAEIQEQTGKETAIQVKLSVETEEQNKSVMVFTIITTVFLPLSFFTSYFGMNTEDIRDMDMDQHGFWVISGPLSVFIVMLVMGFAFRMRIKRGLNTAYKFLFKRQQKNGVTQGILGGQSTSSSGNQGATLGGWWAKAQPFWLGLLQGKKKD